MAFCKQLTITFCIFAVQVFVACEYADRPDHHYRPPNVQDKYGSGYGFRFSTIYQSNMVLQRYPQRAVLWGFGEAGQQAKVIVGETSYIATIETDWQGQNIWRVVLKPMEAGGPYHVTASSIWKGEKVEVVLENVMFGDVWLCGGQSNMAFSVGMMNSSDVQRELKIVGNYHDVRVLTVDRYYSDTPVEELDYLHILQHWTVASADAIVGPDWKFFSAVCWLYGRMLYDHYKIPIGLISSNYGGTRVEAWSSHDALKSCGIDEIKYNYYMKHRQTFLESDKNTAHVLWNAMITPFLNTTIKGVIWYQGEANANTGSYHGNPDVHNPYDCSFPAMINDWRKKWYQSTGGNTDPKFPFGFVQLASIFTDASSKEFPLIRYEQTADRRTVPNDLMENVFMAVAMDLPDDHSPYGSIHPRDKTTVADRLIRGARVIAYGETGVNFKGPILDNCTLITKEFKYQVKMSYYNVDKNGLTVMNTNGFEVFTVSSEVWIPVSIATLTPDKQSILLDIPNKHIIAVRYAWNKRPCDYKQCAIYSVTDKLPSPQAICYITSN